MSEGLAAGLTPAGPITSSIPAVESQCPACPTFELLLQLLCPSKRVRTPNRKTKVTKVEPENKGPFEIPVKIEWDAFLGVIVEKLAVQQPDLVMASLEWHWLKPASGPWLPVQDEAGFMSMLKQIKVKSGPYVIVRMQVPSPKATRLGNTWDNEDEDEDNFEDNSVSKKVRLLHSFTLCIVHLLVGKA